MIKDAKLQQYVECIMQKPLVRLLVCMPIAQWPHRSGQQNYGLSNFGWFYQVAITKQLEQFPDLGKTAARNHYYYILKYTCIYEIQVTTTQIKMLLQLHNYTHDTFHDNSYLCFFSDE